MTKGITLSTAYLAILPETSQLVRGVKKASRSVAKELSLSGQSLGKSIDQSFKKAGRNSKRSGNTIGKNLGSGLGTSLTRAVGSSMTGVRTLVTKSLGGAFQGITTGVSNASSSAGRSMVKILRNSALTAGAAVSGVMAVSLGSGFQRLNAIDQAESKLKGLGNTAGDIETIMSNANAAVKGTSYGLDEAASVAAASVASGIKPGKDLERVLKTIADTSAIAGLEMSNVGSIFNSVLARGKLQGDDMLQLTSQGVPVGKFLADEMGVAQSAISDLVSKGKIDFSTFEEAMRNGLGGSALASGDTFTGAAKNMRAAMGRLGATSIVPFFENSPKLFSSVGVAFDALNKEIVPLADQLSAKLAPITDDLALWIETKLPGVIMDGIPKIGEGLSWIRDKFTFFRDEIYPIITEIGGFVGNTFTKMVEHAPTVISWFGSIRDSVVDMVAAAQPHIETAKGWVENIAAAIAPHLPAIGDWVNQVIGWGEKLSSNFVSAFNPSAIIREGTEGVASTTMGDLFGSIGSSLSEIAPKLIELLPPLTDLIGSFAEAFSSISAELWKVVLQLIEALLPVVSSLLDILTPAIKGVADLFSANPELTQTLAAFFLAWMGAKKIAGPLNSATKAIGGFLGVAGKKVSGGISSANNWMTGGVVNHPDGVKVDKNGKLLTPKQAKSMGGFSKLKAGGAKGAAKLAGKGALKGAGALAKGALRFLGPWGLALSVLLEVVPLIINNWDKIVEFFKGIKEKLQPFIDWIKGIFEGFKQYIKDSYDRLLGVIEWLGNLRTLIWEKVKNIPQAFIDLKDQVLGKFYEIRDKITGFIDWTGEIRADIWEKIKNIPGIFTVLKDLIGDKLSDLKDIILKPFKDAQAWMKDKFSGILPGGWDLGGLFGGGDSGGVSLMGGSSGGSVAMASQPSGARLFSAMSATNTMATATAAPVQVRGVTGNDNSPVTFNLESETYSDMDVARMLSDVMSQLGYHDAKIQRMGKSMSTSAIGYHRNHR